MYEREAGFDETLKGFRPTAAPLDSGGARPVEGTLREHQKASTQGDWWKRGSFGDFFRVPNPLHRSGIAAQVGPAATALYLGLLDQAARRNSSRFKVSDRKLGANTGISERSIVALRKTLVEARLIRYSTQPGQSPVYELLVIDAREIPYENRPRAKKRPRGRSVAKHQTVSIDPWDGLPQILRGTSANYARPCANSA
jgi:hypothetical protein